MKCERRKKNKGKEDKDVDWEKQKLNKAGRQTSKEGGRISQEKEITKQSRLRE